MEVRESIYTFEIARRAVGRAAFSLGIDTLSEVALDVLSDVLLAYLNRVSRTLSHLAESSGRTSAHVNILDALQACELVASPAVERLHIRDDSAEDEGLFAGTGASSSQTHLSSDWKGLASFLFGPRWMEDSDNSSLGDKRRQTSVGGGKVGPSATDGTENLQKKAGWDAPCLDEVQPFPQASKKCANPHPLSPYVGLSLHRAVDEDKKTEERNHAIEAELDQTPDDVFEGSWGSIRKRKAESINDRTDDVTMANAVEESESTKQPPKKKVKIADGSAKDAEEHFEKEEEEAQEEFTARLRLPNFYPPPPVRKSSVSKQSRTVVDTPPPPRSSAQGEDRDGSRAVRASLVQLGGYWGSGWDAPKEDTALSVPTGRSEPDAALSSLVIPLGRASGSRVSRILEGSMDASAMQ